MVRARRAVIAGVIGIVASMSGCAGLGNAVYKHELMGGVTFDVKTMVDHYPLDPDDIGYAPLLIDLPFSAAVDVASLPLSIPCFVVRAAASRS